MYVFCNNYYSAVKHIGIYHIIIYTYSEFGLNTTNKFPFNSSQCLLHLDYFISQESLRMSYSNLRYKAKLILVIAFNNWRIILDNC